MPVTFLIPGPLRSFAGGKSHIVIEQSPTTLADALEALWKRCPGDSRPCGNRAGSNPASTSTYSSATKMSATRGVFRRPIPDGAEISIIPAISGG